jgi:hypothetical protein
VNALRYHIGVSGTSVLVDETKDVTVTATYENGNPAAGLVLSAQDERAKVQSNGNVTIGADGTGVLSVTGIQGGTGLLAVKPLTSSQQGKKTPLEVVKVHLKQAFIATQAFKPGEKVSVPFRFVDDHGNGIPGIKGAMLGNFDNNLIKAELANDAESDEGGYINVTVTIKKARAGDDPNVQVEMRWHDQRATAYVPTMDTP